jgi:hypothetical protein
MSASGDYAFCGSCGGDLDGAGHAHGCGNDPRHEFCVEHPNERFGDFRVEPDRRKAPRRLEEIALHYTAQAVVAAAVAWASQPAFNGSENAGPDYDAERTLYDAVRAYERTVKP